MTFSEIFIIACGLSMDALAVSMACGVVNRKERHLNAFKIRGQLWPVSDADAGCRMGGRGALAAVRRAC